uniref:Uncharacterized protein n=1 Tax=Canis lupus familiaris TaxID=9615 RepID=A0A8C0SCV6_CANLF
MPLRGPSNACFTTFLMSSYLAAFSRRQVRSTTDRLGVGTRKAMPVSFPFSSGMTLPTVLAAPVEAGMMFWVAVMAWTVVMRPSTMLKWSWMTVARGAKQLVVQEALLTILRELSYFLWFTPITNMGASAEDGDGLPVDDKFPVLNLDCAVEFAVGRIILEHVHHAVEINEGVIDGNNIHLARVKSNPNDQAPNTAKSVHSDLHHRVLGTRLALRQKMRLSVKRGGTESLILLFDFFFSPSIFFDFSS